HFDRMKNLFKPCKGYAVVLNDNGYDGILSVAYDLSNQEMIIPCGFSDIAIAEKAGLLKA
ncbi:MAG: hypothetical protein J5I62_00360, partial [Flavobacteriales bacterium]|nr:hypothetical protein [Flavobacteriales bacterium]